MTEKRAFFPARSRFLLGVLLLLAAPGLTWGAWYSNDGPLQTLAWYEQNRGQGDSLAYASALYHASHAKAANANRWAPTGYATLGLAGVLLSIGLMASSRSHRKE